MKVKLFNSWDDLKRIVDDRQVKPIRINSRRYLIVRYGETAFLTEPYCPHQDCSLSDAKILPSGELICMWHAYRYRLSDGKESQERSRPLLTYRVQPEENYGVFVEL